MIFTDSQMDNLAQHRQNVLGSFIPTPKEEVSAFNYSKELQEVLLVRVVSSAKFRDRKPFVFAMTGE